MRGIIPLSVLILNLSAIFGRTVLDNENPMNALYNVQRASTDVRKYMKEVNDGEIHQQNYLASSSDIDDVIERADELLSSLSDNKRAGKADVSVMCRNATIMFLKGLVNRTSWAFHMLDAYGKPGSDLLNYHLTWLGSYDECMAVHSNPETGPPFSGQYCLAPFTIKSQPLLNVGLCVPDSCSSEDTDKLVSGLITLVRINMTQWKQGDAVCHEAKIPYSSKAIAVIVICCVFLVIMISATIYDIVLKFLVYQAESKSESMKEAPSTSDVTPLLRDQHNGSVQYEGSKTGRQEEPNLRENKHKPGLLGKLLLSFSVYTNAPKVFNTSTPAGTLTAVNGVRFYSMLWVILGHTYVFVLNYSDNYVTILPVWIHHRFSFQLISNATFAVDTFFSMSGLLVAYLTLKEMKKRGGVAKFKWGMFYFHRFWRLTPPYMLFLMLYVCLMRYWGDGPMWRQQGMEKNECKDTWWKNLLYINNLGNDAIKNCMGWSWYLANDMQFYIISPLLLIPFFYSGVLGAIGSAVLIVACFIATGVISSVNKLPADIIIGNEQNNFNVIYVKPWCRIGPYIVGLAAGYVLYATDCKLRIPKVINVLAWLTAAGVSVAVLYGLYAPDDKDLSASVAALYNATSRTAWGACIAWVIVACATGNGGPINSLLSWPAIIPLSRLTYCAYLVHPVVMHTFYDTRRTLVHMRDLEMIYLFFGHACMSYMVAFVVSLAFESPMMGLEKVLLGRSKRS